MLALINRKDDYIKSLKPNKKDQMGNALKPNEIEERFQKVLDSKGKDKGRQKFNHFTNEQLRSLKYKSKVSVTNSSQSPAKKNKNLQDDDE